MKYRFFICVIGLLFSHWSFAVKHDRYECTIVDGKGTIIKQFMSGLCIYANDGHTLASSQMELSLFAPNGDKLWRKALNCHHLIHFVGQNILVMNSSVHKYRNELTRFDRLSIFDRKGNEISYFDFFDHREKLLELTAEPYRQFRGETYITLREPSEFLPELEKKQFVPVYVEFSHANSIYEIPENPTAKSIKAFAKGNYIVHANGLQLTFILDRKLKNILWSTHTAFHVHDVQVLSSGEILYYDNFHSKTSSSIEKIEPISMKKTVVFAGSENNKFYGENQGSVQLLESGNLLISEFNFPDRGRAFEITPMGKQVWSRTLKLPGLQEYKRLDLSKYLNKNKHPFSGPQ